MAQPFGGAPAALFFRRPIFQYSERRAVQVLELVGAQGPEEGREAGAAEQQGDRNQDHQAVHDAAERSRSELATTMIEEQDMAMAAIIGVTKPASASGIARQL